MPLTHTPHRLSITLAVFAGFTILLVSVGIRQSLGLIVPSLISTIGWSLAAVSLPFAVQNLLWGALSPFAALLSKRIGANRVLFLGLLIYALGLYLLSTTTAPGYAQYFLGNGLLLGIAISATIFPVVFGAIATVVPRHQHTFYFALVTAGGAAGQLLFAILTQILLTTTGWVMTLRWFSVLILAILPCAFFLRNKPESATPPPHEIATPMVMRPLVILLFGFFVCGFHIGFLSIHLPNYTIFCGMLPEVAAYSLSLIGAGNIFGTLAAGWLGTRVHTPRILSAIYGLRTVVFLFFLVTIKSSASFYLFSAITGVLWLATVPLTSSAISYYYGVSRLGVLVGGAMFSHQIGAFVGVWSSALLFDRFNDYNAAWVIAILLSFIAMVVHFPLCRFNQKPISAENTETEVLP